MTTQIILFSLIALIAGAVVGYFFSISKVKSLKAEKQKEADDVLNRAEKSAEEIRRNAKKEAKEIIQEERADLEKEYNKKVQSVADQERNLTKKEISLDQKIEAKERDLEHIKRKEEELDREKSQTQLERGKLLERQKDISEKLERVAAMTQEEAKAELISIMEEEARVDAAKMIKRIEEETQEEAEKKGKRILAIAMQRFAGEFVAEQTISSVELPTDEIKGRLIGREGRNIRAFEQICGVDLIIDDTPGMVVISSFNVVRKVSYQINF